jgi:hypothetical protein
MTELVHGVYRHYKGGYYLLMGIAQHTETKEELVMYVSLTGAHMPGSRLRARPLLGPDGWLTDTAEGQKRFTYVGGTVPIGQA